MVIVYANTYLQSKALSQFASVGLEVFGGGEAQEMNVAMEKTKMAGTVLLTVVDSLTFIGQDYALRWIRDGRLPRMFFDEPHEIPSQESWRPVMAEFVRLCHGTELGRVSWTLMTGSANKEIDDDLTDRFKLQDSSTVSTRIITIPPHLVRNPNVKYDAISCPTFDAACSQACRYAKVSHDSRKPHVIGVLTKKHADLVFEKLQSMEVASFVHTSDVRALQGNAVVNKVVDSWMAGTSSFYVLITTRVVFGWNHEKLVECDWVGAWGLCGASQDGTRPGRNGVVSSCSRFYRWENWARNI
jgi:superfamily II DNA helicase RecQ